MGPRFLSLFLSIVLARPIPARAAPHPGPPCHLAPRPYPAPPVRGPRAVPPSLTAAHCALPCSATRRHGSPRPTRPRPVRPRQPSCPRALAGRLRPAPPCTVRRAVPAPTRHAKACGSSGLGTPRRSAWLVVVLHRLHSKISYFIRLNW